MAKVLVIEDDDDVRKIVCRMLRSGGHETIETSQGEAGLAALHRDQPDLVVTDLIMPDSDGIETIAKIREVSGLPIIAMSGMRPGSTYSPLIDAQLMGADLTIKKPFTVEAFLAAVNELLDGDPRSERVMRRLLSAVVLCLAIAAPAAAQITVGGDVPKPYVMTPQVFSTFDLQEIAADNGDGMHWYRGVPLCGLLERAGVVFGEALKDDAMAAYVLIEGADGFRVVLPLASLDDMYGGGIFLAGAMDGARLPAGQGPYRLIIADDTRTTRWVKQVVKVTVQSPPV